MIFGVNIPIVLYNNEFKKEGAVLVWVKLSFVFGLVSGAMFLSSCANMASVHGESIEFEKVTEVKGYSKDSLYEGTKLWVAETFNSAKAVIEYENKNEGTLIGNGKINYPCEAMECLSKKAWIFGFKMRLDVKEEKFKMHFSNIILNCGTSTEAGYTGPIYNAADSASAARALMPLSGDLEIYLKQRGKKANW